MGEIKEMGEVVRKIFQKKLVNSLEKFRKEEEVFVCSEMDYLVCEQGEYVDENLYFFVKGKWRRDWLNSFLQKS